MVIFLKIQMYVWKNNTQHTVVRQVLYRPENLRLAVALLPSLGHNVLVAFDTFLAKQVQLQSLMEQHLNLENTLQVS